MYLRDKNFKFTTFNNIKNIAFRPLSQTGSNETFRLKVQNQGGNINKEGVRKKYPNQSIQSVKFPNKPPTDLNTFQHTTSSNYYLADNYITSIYFPQFHKFAKGVPLFLCQTLKQEVALQGMLDLCLLSRTNKHTIRNGPCNNTSTGLLRTLSESACLVCMHLIKIGLK